MKTILVARNASPGNKNAKMSSALIDERGVKWMQELDL